MSLNILFSSRWGKFLPKRFNRLIFKTKIRDISRIFRDILDIFLRISGKIFRRFYVIFVSTPTSYPSKRALRVVCFAPSYAHTVPFLMNAKTLPVSVIYFDICKGLAPSPLRNIFTRSDEIHRYNTRHATKTIIIRKR